MYFLIGVILAEPWNCWRFSPRIGGGSIRYVNEKGLEYNQAFAKSLTWCISELIKYVTNYLSSAVLDAGDNVTNNDNDVLVDGKDYTTMEHKWDEAFGYLYGA